MVRWYPFKSEKNAKSIKLNCINIQLTKLQNFKLDKPETFVKISMLKLESKTIIPTSSQRKPVYLTSRYQEQKNKQKLYNYLQVVSH